MALGGLALAAGAVALLAGGGERPAARSTPAATGGKRAPTAAAARSRPAQTRTASAPAAAPASAPPAVPADDPATLNDRGFALMKQGRYGEAIAPLQRAVDGACGPGAGLTCAYALYNLGRSLRLSGRPAEAIPILQRRLQFADQRGAVQLELDQARRAAGIAPPQPAPPAPGAKDKRGNGHGKHGQGGEGG
jgi:tetratricopeptide (TPR) repeat protein